MEDVGPHPVWQTSESGRHAAQEPEGSVGVRFVLDTRGGNGGGTGHLAAGGRPAMDARLRDPARHIFPLAGVVRFRGGVADRLTLPKSLRAGRGVSRTFKE